MMSSKVLTIFLFTCVFIGQFGLGDAGAAAAGASAAGAGAAGAAGAAAGAGAAVISGPVLVVAAGVGLIGFGLTCIFLPALVPAIVATAQTAMIGSAPTVAASKSYCLSLSVLCIFSAAFVVSFMMVKNYRR